MFYSNSSVCDKAEHCVGPSPGSEDGAGAGAGGGTSLELRWQLQIKGEARRRLAVLPRFVLRLLGVKTLRWTKETWQRRFVINTAGWQT